MPDFKRWVTLPFAFNPITLPNHLVLQTKTLSWAVDSPIFVPNPTGNHPQKRPHPPRSHPATLVSTILPGATSPRMNQDDYPEMSGRDFDRRDNQRQITMYSNRTSSPPPPRNPSDPGQQRQPPADPNIPPHTRNSGSSGHSHPQSTDWNDTSQNLASDEDSDDNSEDFSDDEDVPMALQSAVITTGQIQKRTDTNTVTALFAITCQNLLTSLRIWPQMLWSAISPTHPLYCRTSVTGL